MEGIFVRLHCDVEQIDGIMDDPKEEFECHNGSRTKQRKKGVVVQERGQRKGMYI